MPPSYWPEGMTVGHPLYYCPVYTVPLLGKLSWIVQEGKAAERAMESKLASSVSASAPASCWSSRSGFFGWWTGICKDKPNKCFLPQVAFGQNALSHIAKKQRRTTDQAESWVLLLSTTASRMIMFFPWKQTFPGNWWVIRERCKLKARVDRQMVHSKTHPKYCDWKTNILWGLSGLRRPQNNSRNQRISQIIF